MDSEDHPHALRLEPSSWAARDKSWLKTCFDSIPTQTEAKKNVLHAKPVPNR